MPTNEQLVKLSTMLTETLESVMYTYDKGIDVDEEYVEKVRKVTLLAKEFLSL